MSDSDDTDLLLLIPPDFFLVQSPDLYDIDSEDDYELENSNQLFNQSVVNDLITHVNELESRICVIENLDSSRLPTLDNNTLDLNQSYSESNSHQFKSWPKQTNDTFNHISLSNSVHLLSGSIDGIQHHYLKSRNDFVSPPRSRQPFSLPSVPTCREYNKSELCSSELNYKEANNPNLGIQLEDYKGKKCISNKGSENLTANEKQRNFTESAIGGVNQTTVSNTKVLPGEKELLVEVDQYLINVAIHGGIFQNKDEKLITYPITSHQSNKNISFESGFKIMDANSDNPTSSQTLDLMEVDRLLKEMEATQYTIEQKLKLNNPPKKILEASLGKFTYYDQMRDKTEIYSSKSKKNIDSNEKTYPSLTKETFIKRNMLPSNQNNNTIENSVINVTDPLIHNSHSAVSKINLEYKGLDKQPVLTSDFKSHHQNTKNIPDLENAENMTLKYLRIAESQNQEPNTHKHFSPTKFNISKHVGLESLRDKFNSERDRRLYLLQSQETAEYKDVYNVENNHSKNARIKRSGAEHYQRVNDGRHQAYGDILSHHGKHPVESTVVHSLEQKPTSTNLLSLTDLWNKEPIFHSDDPNKLRQKLEEEKYRRQHCEEMIQNLQYRVLEEQEKLAVAVRVDQEKDKAIVQLTEAWRKLAKHWGELEEQRHSLAQQLQTERESNKIKVEEMTKKINRWETEVAQSLDLAAGYKEKCEVMTKERDALKKDLQTRIEDAEKQIETVSEQNQLFLKERNEMKQQIEQYRRENEEDKQTIKEIQTELEEVKKQLYQCEAEINVLVEQKQALSEKLKDERAHSNAFEQQKLTLQQALDEAKKKEKIARDEARIYEERIEVARTELRALYQGQLEAVVRDKLREFQNQLDAAEAALKAELQSREKSWAEKANNQCKLVIEKCKTELQQIQSQHREELMTWKVKVIDCERLKTAIESQLQEETGRRTDIAQRLHSVMETQWREALRIITDPNAVESNVNSTSHFEHEIQSPQHLGGEKNHIVRLDLKDVPHNQGHSVASVARREDFPFVEEGKATYSLADAQPQQDQLKKYIQMLLDQAPGNPVDGRDQSGLWDEPNPGNPPLSTESSFGGKWSAFMPLQDGKKTNNPLENSDNARQNGSKPQWH